MSNREGRVEDTRREGTTLDGGLVVLNSDVMASRQKRYRKRHKVPGSLDASSVQRLFLNPLNES